MYKRKRRIDMKKSNLIKLFSILLISVMVVMFSTNVFAADDANFTELTVSNGTNTGNTGNSGNTAGNSTGNNTGNNTGNTNNTNANRNNTNNNSSIYNNTNLPKTGIEDSIPVAMLVVVFGISAVYAYKKIKDYRNI